MCAKGVLLNSGVDGVELATVVELTEAFSDGGFALSDGFYLGACQHNTRSVLAKYLVFKLGALVEYVYIFLNHSAKVRIKGELQSTEGLFFILEGEWEL